jgi:hypothetical protein
MKTVAVVCNLLSLAFTCAVVATDGVPREVAYIVFTLLLMLVPAVTVFALVSRRDGSAGLVSAASPAVRGVAVVANAIVVGFVCWALVDQHPHPEEGGFVEYVILMLLTPVLSIVALMWRGRTRRAAEATA